MTGPSFPNSLSRQPPTSRLVLDLDPAPRFHPFAQPPPRFDPASLTARLVVRRDDELWVRIRGAEPSNGTRGAAWTYGYCLYKHHAPIRRFLPASGDGIAALELAAGSPVVKFERVAIEVDEPQPRRCRVRPALVPTLPAPVGSPMMPTHLSASLRIHDERELVALVRVSSRPPHDDSGSSDSSFAEVFLLHRHDRPIRRIVSGRFSTAWTAGDIDTLYMPGGELIQRIVVARRAAGRCDAVVHFNPIVFEEAR